MNFQYESGTCVSMQAVDRACEQALKAIEKELPKEALTYEVYSTVIEQCADRLRTKRIVL